MVIQIVVEKSYSNNNLQKNYNTKTLSTNILNYKLNNDNLFINNKKLKNIEVETNKPVNNNLKHENNGIFFESHNIMLKENEVHNNKDYDINEFQLQSTNLNINSSLISKKSYTSQIASTSGISSRKLSQKSPLLCNETFSSVSVLTQNEKKKRYINKYTELKENNEDIEEDELNDQEFDDDVSVKKDIDINFDENEISIEKRHKCNICGKGFPYMSILESHKRCHTGEKPFSCHFCDKKFAQKATLQVHERTHTGERPYKCKYCDKNFAQYGTKTVHEKSAHLGIRNYKCPKCSKCLSSPSALYTHKKTHGDKSFQCNFCPKQFTLKNYLKLHIKQVHEHSERKHICKFCLKTFAYPGSLQVHIRTHTGERPYVCKFCPKSFASQGNLQSHERTHTGERPYSCHHCGRSFIQKSQLTAHEATHAFGGCVEFDEQSLQNSAILEEKKSAINNLNCYTNPDFIQIQKQCLQNTEFPKNITASSSLTLLSVVATENDSINAVKERNAKNDFVCKFCGKRYAYASSLYVHTRLHTGERPFKCNFCDKTFTNQGNMQVHLRVHTGEKPYKCDACNKSYAQKVGLKIHQEQCQIYLNRRGSVMTVETNDSSETSPTISFHDCNETVSNSLLNLNEQIIVNEKQKQFSIKEKSLLLTEKEDKKISVLSIDAENDNNQLNKISSSPITQISIYKDSLSLIENNDCKTETNYEKMLLENQNYELMDNKILKNQQISFINKNEYAKKNNHSFVNNFEVATNNEITSSTKLDSLLKSNLLLQPSLQNSQKHETLNFQNNNEIQQHEQQQILTLNNVNGLDSNILNKSTIQLLQEDEQVMQYGIVPIQSNALPDLLLEQLKQQKKQQQQLQQFFTLKALLELTSLSNLQQNSPNFTNIFLSNLTSSSTSLPQPQPLYTQQQQQQFNLQLFQQQQLLTQLLHIQKLEHQKKQILPIINNNNLSNYILPAQTNQFSKTLNEESKNLQFVSTSLNQLTNLNMHKTPTTIKLTSSIEEEL